MRTINIYNDFIHRYMPILEFYSGCKILKLPNGKKVTMPFKNVLNQIMSIKFLRKLASHKILMWINPVFCGYLTDQSQSLVAKIPAWCSS